MGTLIVPIFAFGCVITGIVFLGVLQAHDFAKSLQVIATNPSEVADGSNNGEMIASVPALAGSKGLSSTSQP